MVYREALILKTKVSPIKTDASLKGKRSAWRDPGWLWSGYGREICARGICYDGHFENSAFEVSKERASSSSTMEPLKKVSGKSGKSGNKANSYTKRT